jgi:ATP-dependent Lon protease
MTDFENIPDSEPDEHGLIECPILPLRDFVVFPGVVTSIPLKHKLALAAVQHGLQKHRTVIAISQSTIEGELYKVGTEIALGRLIRDVNEGRSVLVQGRRRVELVEIIKTEPFMIGKARPISTRVEASDELQPLLQNVSDLIKRAADLNIALTDDVLDYILDTSDPGLLADLVASTLNASFEERQQLLENRDVEQRLRQVAYLLNQELNVLELRDEINIQVQQEIDRSQRESYLREQMRVIQTELGETDIFQQEYNEVRDQVFKAYLPSDIHEKAMKELSRLMLMPPMAPEVGIIRTYIDWLAGLPWKKASEDNLDIAHAQKALDEAHYGLPKVKDRILEYIAVRKLAPTKMKSPILCFVGPPGVGKTSLGRSIAKALGREFVRVSLGGVRDEAEIRGHRRTYIGALPGRVIQTMRRAGTVNPVFMLDEIDKLGMDFRGDPSSALLEVLDPEQNNAFSDHYLEVPYDLSKVLFITTANDLDPLPPALLDRLEIIEFSSYTEEEKLAITRRFLLPSQLEAHGLEKAKVSFEKRTLQAIIREYTYEAGVRNLNREIANICRKLARLLAEDKPLPPRILPSKLIDYLGPPVFTQKRLHKDDAIGLVTGLVWTYDGGDITLIEVSIMPGKGTLLMTGQLGEVMQESAQTALSYLRARASDFDIPSDDFENYDVHVHLPEGAVPKEGPSAGITLATAIISAFTERKARSEYAMTGEITLHGKVLPVGGVKEKVLAARRAGIKKVILPAENKKDLIDVPKEALDDLTLFFVSDMQQVIDRVLLAPPPESRKRDLERQDEEKDEKEKDEKNEKDSKSSDGESK